MTFNAASLAPNTTYFIRIGNVTGGTTNYNATQPSTSTLASLLTNVLIYQVNTSSVAVNWTAWASTGPGANTSQGYELDDSTMSTFVPLWTTSTTTGVGLSTLTVSGLTNATTYYLRAGGLNFNNVANFVMLSSTRTR